MSERGVESGPNAHGLLRALVLLLALTEVGAVAYAAYALFIDDTTSWIITVIPDLEDVWRPMLLPSAVAGGIALLLAATDRLLWLALFAVCAGPLISVALLA